MDILIGFKCPTQGCGYSEDVGVDVSIGIVLKGDLTIICPRCGGVSMFVNQIVLKPVRFQRMKPAKQPWENQE